MSHSKSIVIAPPNRELEGHRSEEIRKILTNPLILSETQDIVYEPAKNRSDAPHIEHWVPFPEPTRRVKRCGTNALLRGCILGCDVRDVETVKTRSLNHELLRTVRAYGVEESVYRAVTATPHMSVLRNGR